MLILKKGHQPGVYVPLRALFLVFTIFARREASACLIVQRTKQGSRGYHFYRLWYGAAEIQTK